MYGRGGQWLSILRLRALCKCKPAIGWLGRPRRRPVEWCLVAAGGERAARRRSVAEAACAMAVQAAAVP